MINEIEWHQLRTKAWLEAWIESHSKPNFLAWFGFYPAKASVDAARAQLKAMNEYGLFVSTADSIEIFNSDKGSKP